MSKGFARNGWPRGSAMVLSSDFVASATPHTKGSWVQVVASAADNVAGLWIRSNITIGNNGVDTSMLLDIGIGAAASEAVVVPDVPVGGAGVKLALYLPIYIPAGTRIAGRVQSAVVSDTYGPEVCLVYGGRPGTWGGYTIAETIGINTATSGPTTGDLADNAWDEAVASTANSYRALTFHPCSVPGSTSATAGSVSVDIGYGAGGSEQVVGAYRTQLTVNEQIPDFVGPNFVEKAIDAGSRLAIRKNGTADLSGALIGWR